MNTDNSLRELIHGTDLTCLYNLPMDFGLPPIWLLFWYFLWLVLPFLSAWQIYKFRRLVRKQGVREDDETVEYAPQTAIILPIKGVDERFEQNLLGLMQQEYPAYRLIFVTQSDQDPAYAALHEKLDDSDWMKQRADGLISAELHVAGLAEAGGQKVWNQLHGIKQVKEEDVVVAFADADAVPNAGWLKALVFPLYKLRVGVSTGYRWMIPANGTLASCLASVMNATVATMADQRRRNMAWGGAMAIRREDLEGLGVIESWQGALSDDIQITSVVKQSGKLVYFVPKAMCPSPVHFTMGSLFEFGRRQYLITRTHRPRAWWFAFIALGLYLLGWCGALLGLVGDLAGWWQGGAWTLVMVAMIYLMDNWRASTRAGAIREAFGDEVFKQLRGAMLVERLLTPLYMGVHWLLVLSSCVGRRITWGGVKYLIKGPQSIEIEGRSDT